MEMNMDTQNKNLLRDRYEKIDLGAGYEALYRGELFYAADAETTIYDVLSVCRMFIEGKLDFNRLHGSFRLIIENLGTGERTFFGDNSGLLVFYYRNKQKDFTDCLLEFAGDEDRIEPDYYSVAQYLMYGYVLTFDTLISGVRQADPECYYTLEENGIKEHSKDLKRVAEMYDTLSVGDVIERSMKATGGNYGAVCTGGTDSRSILAWVYAHGGRPELSITGRSENQDVKIAEKIASKLGLKLHEMDAETFEDDWLDKAFVASGGITELNTGYRLLRKARSNRDLGIGYEFGGVAGEMYKNEFVSKDYPFYGGAPDAEKFAKNFYSSTSISDSALGVNTREFMKDEMIRRNAAMFSNMIEGGKFPSYNNIGYHIMMRKYVNITNGFSNYFVPIQPLTDRDVVAGVSKKNAHDLEAQKWHREQIDEACPQIAAIETNLGYSCSNKRGDIASDAFGQRAIFFKHAWKYVMRKIGVGHATKSQWDTEYRRAMDTPEYKESLEICRKLGILSDDSGIKGLSPFASGRILLLGKLFGKCRTY